MMMIVSAELQRSAFLFPYPGLGVLVRVRTRGRETRRMYNLVRSPTRYRGRANFPASAYAILADVAATPGDPHRLMSPPFFPSFPSPVQARHACTLQWLGVTPRLVSQSLPSRATHCTRCRPSPSPTVNIYNTPAENPAIAKSGLVCIRGPGVYSRCQTPQLRKSLSKRSGPPTRPLMNGEA